MPRRIVIYVCQQIHVLVTVRRRAFLTQVDTVTPLFTERCLRDGQGKLNIGSTL